MTWADGIALAVGLTALALLTHHQHRSTTTQHPSRTEHRNGPHHQHGEDHHPGGEEDRSEDDRGEEDGHRPDPA